MSEANAASGSDDLVSLWQATRRRLEQAGIDTPILDARLLLEQAAGIDRTKLITDPRQIVGADVVAKLAALTARRQAREPLAYIFGHTEFMGLRFSVNQHVLIPRADSEIVAYTSLAALTGCDHPRILDLGTGSGALVLSVLARRPDASGVGCDISAPALLVAKHNAQALGLDDRVAFLKQDMLATSAAERLADGGLRYDLVISNPPYICRDEISDLMPEICRFEPHSALDGGADGLDFYRVIAAILPQLLTPNGQFVLEIGKGQCDAICGLLMEQGLEILRVNKDLSGIERALWGQSRHG